MLWLACVNSAMADGSPVFGLCHANEGALFSCPTSRARWISLCGTGKSLQYRFGRVGAVELVFPTNAESGPQTMFFADYRRPRVERAEVRFENQGTEYAIFDYQEEGKRLAGVRVTVAGGQELDVRCAGPVRGRLLELKPLLRCDPDNALNGGRCL
jgi:hypothetical protein